MAERTRIDKRRIDRKVSGDQATAPGADPGTTANRAWDTHNDGPGGEGLSKGYGGSGGAGTGPAGPEVKTSEESKRGGSR